MTKPQPLEKDKEPRHWILQTFGLAFGLAVLMVVIVTVAVMALESPSNRRVAASAAPIATATPLDTAGGAIPVQSVAEAPTIAPEPTQTPVAKPTVALAPTQISFDINFPLVANQGRRTVAQSPTRTPQPTAMATPLPTVTVRSVARSAVATRTTAPKSTAAAPRQPAATAVPNRPFDFSFYVKEYCASERSFQILQVMLTAHGGVPPYDYYNDATLVGQAVAGSVVVEVKAAYGNPVPFKLIAVDRTGQRYSETFFWKSTKRCSWKPLP